MNVVVLSGSPGTGRPWQLDFTRPASLMLTTLIILGALGAAFAIGLQVGRYAGGAAGSDTSRLRRALAWQQDEITQLKARVQVRADAVAARLGALNAHMARVDALGRRLIDEATRPSGPPVAIPVISSYFGWRKDPVNGEEGHFHEGLDFAGVLGQPVQAVAAGVVVRAGEDGGYGNLVEINHGNGYVTRYAHAERILVKVGQSVVRGQEIALLGSTGHSTGPHVHFEVRYNGYPLDPLPFIKPDPARQAGRLRQ